MLRRSTGRASSVNRSITAYSVAKVMNQPDRRRTKIEQSGLGAVRGQKMSTPETTHSKPRVIWHVAMSLDGYITAPNDGMDWIRGYARPAEMIAEIIASTGAILAGRRWYDVVSGQEWDRVAPYGGAWQGPIFVLTHRPPPTTTFPVQFLSGDLEAAVETAKVAAKGQNIVLFGATLSGAALRSGLVDELIVHIAPVLLGGGVRLYEASALPMRLTSIADPTRDDLVTLRYRVSG
jgi:dihydrofolate reductase